MNNFQNIFHSSPDTPLNQKIFTYGAFRPCEIETICAVEMREETFRQMVTNTLKLCNLFEPIMKAVEELNPDKKSSSLIKVNDILTVLSAGLFYRHMIKFNTQNPITKNLTNNRLTEINIKVITASVLVFASKKLSLEQIASSMLIFSLQQALLGLKPFGLPLELGNMQKSLKKIERIINVIELKNFILASREEKDSNYIEPDQFIYLTAISRRKSTSSAIFFQKKRVRNLITPETNVEIHEEKSKEDSKPIETEVTRQKIRGLSLHTISCNEKGKKLTDLYKTIKQCLYKKTRAKSMLLEVQMKKNPRPQSSNFRKSVILFKHARSVEKFIENQRQQLNRFQQEKKNKMLVKKKISLRIKGTGCKIL